MRIFPRATFLKQKATSNERGGALVEKSRAIVPVPFAPEVNVQVEGSMTRFPPLVGWLARHELLRGTE